MSTDTDTMAIRLEELALYLPYGYHDMLEQAAKRLRELERQLVFERKATADVLKKWAQRIERMTECGDRMAVDTPKLAPNWHTAKAP